MRVVSDSDVMRVVSDSGVRW